MSSMFHKPKVYRSSTGCCICKAKSSSSRFTDSKKYEEDFVKCFQLEEKRNGEICNACVLLVKRWKKLPAGSNRNWRHVVDARAGPGIKSLTKFKAKNKKKLKDPKDEKLDKLPKKKHVYIKGDRDREQSPAMSASDTEEYLAGTGSKGSSRANTPDSSDDNGIGDKSQDMDTSEMDISSFIDLTYFKRKNVCCGTIFVGMMGEVLIEPSLFKRCLGCLARERQRAVIASTIMGASPSHSSSSVSPCHSASTSPAHSVESNNETVVGKAKGFCDSSSDSGYDDSCQGMITESKKIVIEKPRQVVQSIPLVAKSDKPLATVQIQASDKIIPMSTTLRLKANSVSGGAKVPIKLLCKPVALVSSAKLSLANAVAVPPTAAVDFAMRSPAQRLAN